MKLRRRTNVPEAVSLPATRANSAMSHALRAEAATRRIPVRDEKPEVLGPQAFAGLSRTWIFFSCV